MNFRWNQILFYALILIFGIGAYWVGKNQGEIELKDKEHYEGLIEITKADKNIVPIFLKTPDGDLKIISSFSKEFEDIHEEYRLVYLGKMFDVDETVDTSEED